MSMKIKPTANLHIRKGQNRHTRSLAVLRRGEHAELLSDPADVGQSGRWCRVQRYNGVTGYSAAWYLELVPDEKPTIPIQKPDDYPTTGWAGALRALSFHHEPVFVCLPAALEKITAFAGFGRINFAYSLWRNSDDLYEYSSWAHGALDFFIPKGTPLVAMDYGVAMAATDAGSGNPYAAPPKSVIVRHGRDMVLYGHCSETRVLPGQVVSPGDVIALSGTFNSPHLHMECRRMPDDYLTWLHAPGTVSARELLRQANERVELRGSWMVPGMRDLFVNPAYAFRRGGIELEKFGLPLAATSPYDTNGNGHYGDKDDLYTLEVLDYYGAPTWG